MSARDRDELLEEVRRSEEDPRHHGRLVVEGDKDVRDLLQNLLTLLFFLTPILYRLEDLPGAESRPWLIDLLHWGNPMTPAVEAFRTPLYAGALPPAADTLYLCVAAGLALVLGALVFSAVDDRIASEA